jgi:hypothetical protein
MRKNHPFMIGVEYEGATFQMLPWENIQIDNSYQRDMNWASASKIAKDFDASLFRIIVVCRRTDGSLFAADGQHRLSALKIRKDKGLTTPKLVLCQIFDREHRSDEARLFIGMNTATAIKGKNLFKAAIEAKCEPHLTVKRMVENAGFSLDFRSAGRPDKNFSMDNGIRSLSNLLKAYYRYGRYVPKALELLKIWGNGKANDVPWEIRNGQLIYSLCIFLEGQGDKTVKKIAEFLKVSHVDIVANWMYYAKEVQGTAKYGKFARSLEHHCKGH